MSRNNTLVGPVPGLISALELALARALDGAAWDTFEDKMAKRQLYGDDLALELADRLGQNGRIRISHRQAKAVIETLRHDPALIQQLRLA